MIIIGGLIIKIIAHQNGLYVTRTTATTTRETDWHWLSTEYFTFENVSLLHEAAAATTT